MAGDKNISEFIIVSAKNGNLGKEEYIFPAQEYLYARTKPWPKDLKVTFVIWSSLIY